MVLLSKVKAYKFEYAYDSSGNLEYIGKAGAGTPTSDANWQIKKLTYTSGNLTAILLADGNENFDNVWDQRSSYSYS